MKSFRGRSPVLVGMFLFVGLAATFLLPYLFPVAPSVSESYIVGFNNRVCVMVFMLFLGAFAWWSDGLGFHAPTGREQMGVDGGQPAAGSRKPLYAALALFGALMACLWLYSRHRVAVAEAMYFLDRMQQLAAGKQPYSDFEFSYGLLFLYFPFWLGKLLHLGLTDGYYLAWIVEFMAGLAVYWAAIQRLPVAADRKSSIFLISAWTWYAGPFSLGENYTPLRFAMAPYLALALLPMLGGGRSWARAVGLGLAAEALLLLISPEQAIAFCVATILFVAMFRLGEAGILLGFVPAFGAGSALLFLGAARGGLFLTMHTMGGGGYNFPLLPVMQDIPIFGLLIVAACALVHAMKKRRPGGAVEYLGLLCVALLPAGFGRSDIGHILINATAGLLAAWVVLAGDAVWWKRARISYVMLVLVLPAPLAIYHFVHTEWVRRAPVVRAGRPSDHQSSTPLLAPFGQPVMNNMPPEFPYVEEGYYHGVELVVQPEQMNRKIAELVAARGEELLVPMGYTCEFGHNPKFFLHVLLTPYVPPARKTVRIYEPMCAYIRSHYHPSQTTTTPYLDYQILEPNEGSVR